MSGRLEGEARRPSEPNELRETPHLSARGRGPERRYAVVAPALVVADRAALCDFRDQALLYHSGNGSIERSSAHAQLALGARFDILDDGVAMSLAVQDSQQDVKGGRRQGKEVVDRLVVHGGYSQGGYI